MDDATTDFVRQWFRKAEHDLQNIRNLPELLPFEEQFEDISEYGVGVRYPDDFYEPTLDEAHRAFELALKIKAIVLDKIQL